MPRKPVQSNQDVALDYYTKAAELGNAEAMGDLGYRYWYGENGAPEDRSKAMEWYIKAVELGDVETMECFYNSLETEKEQGEEEQNQKSSVEPFIKAAECLGSVWAMYFLGDMYLKGVGAPQNDSEAAVWYTKAADQGNGNAMFCLGKLYHTGQGVPKDSSKAAEWFTKSAAIDSFWSYKAMIQLGHMYLTGDGVPKDPSKAVEWYKKAPGTTAREFLTNIAEENPCTICLSAIGIVDLATLACGHSYHTQCIAQWKEMRNGETCPVCRSTSH